MTPETRRRRVRAALRLLERELRLGLVEVERAIRQGRPIEGQAKTLLAALALLELPGGDDADREVGQWARDQLVADDNASREAAAPGPIGGLRKARPVKKVSHEKVS